MTECVQVLEIRTDHDDGGAVFGDPLFDQVVNVALGPDVDALCGLIEQENGGADFDPLGQHTLLLVAAGESAHHLCGVARADVV